MFEKKKRNHTKRAVMLVTGVALAFSACGGCEEEKLPEEPKVEVKKEEPKPKVEEPEVDPLAEAKEDAKEKGVAVAIGFMDRATLIAGLVEGLNKAPDTPKATIKRTTVKATGRIDPKEASKVFRDYNGAMRKCYERALKRSPGLEGRVTLSLLVGSSGAVKSASTRGLNSDVGKCMKLVAKRMEFPPPKGGAAKINKPYTFTPDT
jgi:outer membrane biosynthesis protein TonB